MELKIKDKACIYIYLLHLQPIVSYSKNGKKTLAADVAGINEQLLEGKSKLKTSILFWRGAWAGSTWYAAEAAGVAALARQSNGPTTHIIDAYVSLWELLQPCLGTLELSVKSY